MSTRNQKYAISAHEKVTKVKSLSDKEKSNYGSKYGSMAHKLPVFIRTSGLVQALAFVDAKAAKETAWRSLLNDIASTIGKDDLIKRSREADLSEYMLITREVLAALLWYKRFAQSILGVNDAAE